MHLVSCPASPAIIFKPHYFDFIIISRGTFRLAIANRLSEIPGLTIAVIKAGKNKGNNPNMTSVKRLGSGLGFYTPINWLYKMTEQAYAGGRQLEYHSGKTWGRTSTINTLGMTYIRAKNIQINALFASLVNQTWQQFGVPFNPDISGGNLRGFFVWPQTLDQETNMQDDTARAYYYPVKHHPNLIMIQGHANRISWAERNRSKALAEKVEYTTLDDSVKTLYASKEVIVLAGSIQSPAILELSGIGNPCYSSNSTFHGIALYMTYMTASNILEPETNTITNMITTQLKAWARKIAKDTGNTVSPSTIKHLYQVQHNLIFNQDIPCTNPVQYLVGQQLQPPLSGLPSNTTNKDLLTHVLVTANHHLLSTAAMLPKELGGVMDNTLVIYRTENIKVINTSVLPAQVSGHLTSILYAVTEQETDIIKQKL
ncbi:hypothetical protein BDW59DRAFT_177116 [Aspergillus cavernicola]|uniref:Glucose-methanol-choline oxidoreductase N-terminal domain-containing protein n=1 Tax=Aspergillus cavernicola TaxID=176166 RepID=A0ABR4H5U6_9EURO